MISRNASVCLALVSASGLARAGDLPFESSLKELAGAYPGNVELTSIGKSRQGRPIHLVKLSEGGAAAADRPTLVIVAGVNGMHRVGTDVAVGLAQKLTAEPGEILKNANVFIVPCANPDTMAWHLDTNHPRTDWSRTIVAYDADRDRRVAEDPAEDLNGDGYITMMRVKDPRPGIGLRSEYVADPDNVRLLKKPDAAKGERASFALLIEGIDSDGDGRFNEDGVGGSGGGGIDLDANFPYRWPEWADGAGRYQLCEPESLALTEWLLGLKNVATVLVYGPNDTIVNIPQTGRADQTGQIPLGIEEADKAVCEEVSKLFKEATNMTGAPTGDMAGSFEGWAYGVLGAYAFETPVWVRPDLVKKEEPKKDAAPGDGEKKEGDKAAGADAGAADLTPEQMRARFTNATPEERERMMAEFQNLSPEVRNRMRSRLTGEQPAGGQPTPAPTGAQPQRPGGAPPGGGPAGGGRGGRGGGRGGGFGGPPGGAGGGPAAADGKKAGEPSGDDAKWLKYNDDQVKAGAQSGYLDWKPFTHPQLGEVEIGGFVPGFRMNPPESEIPRLVGEQAKFVTALVGKFPKVRTDPPVVEKLGSLWRITVRTVNDGAMATVPTIGVKARRVTPTIATIDVPMTQIVAGEKIYREWSLAGNGGQFESQWLITGEPGATVNVYVRPTIGPAIALPIKLEESAR